MANFIDYLAWRGDMPLSVDPFNEVDNLILCKLAYADFRGVVPEGANEAVSLGEVFKGFSVPALREEGEGSGSRAIAAKAPLLMEAMLSGARFQDVRLCGHINEIDREKGLQLSATTFLLPDGSAYVAFRGTDGTLVGWKEDFNFSFLPETEGQARSAQYLNAVGRAFLGPLRVGGHSKGGNLAVYAASMCEGAVQNRINAVYSNDGPGFRREFLSAPGYLRVLPKIVGILPDTSIIGQLLCAQGVRRVVKSSASGIQQHDGFTWQVRRNRFEAAAMSDMGAFIGQAMGGWLEQMDDEARKSFTDTVFSLLESTGADTFSGMGEQKWKSAEAMLTAVRAMSRERQQEALRALGQLGQSGGQAAASYLLNLALKKYLPEE